MWNLPYDVTQTQLSRRFDSLHPSFLDQFHNSHWNGQAFCIPPRGTPSNYRFIFSLFVLGLKNIYVMRNSYILKTIQLLKQPIKILLIFPSLIVLAINNRSLFNPHYSMRNGPDLNGWLVSAKYLCEEGSTHSLLASIYHQSGSKNLSEIFASAIYSTADLTKNITAIPSARDQFAAEFLIGAKREGLPGAQAIICKVSDSLSIYQSTAAFFGWSVLLIALIAYNANKTHPTRIRISQSLLAASNLAVLSVLFEGGFGQIATLPIFVFFFYILVLTNKDIVAITANLILIIIVVITTYKDLIFISTAVLGVYLTIYVRHEMKSSQNARTGSSRKKISANKKTLLLREKLQESFGLDQAPRLARLSLFVSLGVFSILSLGDIKSRISSSGITGGWSFNRFPFPSNILGVVNCVPQDGLRNIGRTSWIYFVEIIAMIFIVWVIQKSLPRITTPKGTSGC